MATRAVSEQTRAHAAPLTPDRRPLGPVVAALLADPRFGASPALRRFLEHLATAADRDEAAALKEYAIGVDVFGRREDFDPATDPIVRVQAHRLRVRLADWYAGPGRDDPTIIDLPRGGYRLRVTRAETPGAVALPNPLGDLIGRDEVLGQLAQALRDHRLVTITGPPGIGKSRLALAAARAAGPAFADGARLLELDRVTDPARVPEALFAALGMAAEDRHAAPRDAALALRDARVLLVVDNAEHLVDAVAALARAILDHAPGVVMLATSREPLRLFGEARILPPPLAVPPPGPVSVAELGQWSACALFLDRAAEAGAPPPGTDADAAAIAAVCRRLDGIPLALELAATRAAMLSVQEIEAALARPLPLLEHGERAGPDRHRTLAAALEWSYALLSEEERLLLRCLSVFAGSFDIAAATAVAGARLGGEEMVFKRLASLLDKSLVAREPRGAGARFRLLETTRAFAAARRSQAGEREGLAAMARFMLDRAETITSTFEITPTDRFADEIAPDLDNIRAAIEWAHSPDGDPGLALAITSAVVQIMLELGLVAETRRLMARAVARIDDTTPPDIAANLVHCMGFRFTTLLGSEAATLARASALARQSGQPWLMARVLLVEIQALRATAPERVEPQALEALALVEPLGPSKVQGLGLASRALTHALAGRHDAARADLDRAIAMLTRLDYRWGLPYACAFAVECAVLAGDIPRAVDAGRAAIVAAERPGVGAMAAFAATCLAAALLVADEREEGLAWARGAHVNALAVSEEALVVSAAALVAQGFIGTDPERAAMLLGWTDAERARLSARSRPSEAAARAIADRRLDAILPADVRAAAARRGATVSAAEAAAMAQILPTG